jgi:cytochrome P450
MERQDVRQHMTFGGGQHFCIGAHLTRVEQRVAYGEWLKRFSSIELAQPLESIKYHVTFATRAPVELYFRNRRAA